MLIVSEHFRAPSGRNWCSDPDGLAGVWVLDRDLGTPQVIGRGRGFVATRIRGVTIVGCYLSPNMSLPEYRGRLFELERCIRGCPGPILLGGDFNAKSPLWGSSVQDARGVSLAGLAAALRLLPANLLGCADTFRRRGAGSVIDATFVSNGLVLRLSGWRVLEDLTLSDHQNDSSQRLITTTHSMRFGTQTSSR